MIFLKEFFEKVDFEKKQNKKKQRTKKHAKLPSRQRVKVIYSNKKVIIIIGLY